LEKACPLYKITYKVLAPFATRDYEKPICFEEIKVTSEDYFTKHTNITTT
jgi:hypothetical protein